MTKQFQVEVVNVGQASYTKTAKGGYNSYELAFKQDGKIGGKKFFDFGNKDVYTKLQASKPGDNFSVVSEKDDKGYYQWQSIEATSAQQSTPEAATGEVTQPTSGQARIGRVMGSTYETAEERATKQAIIVRQFAMNAAIEATKITGGDPENASGVVEFDEIAKMARLIEDFVYTDIEGRIASIRAAVKQA